MDCVFCKIVSGEIPSYKIYEDEQCIAFLDINPINPGHFLIITKRHYKTITDAPKKIIQHLKGVEWDLVLKLQQEIDPDGVKIVQNNNIEAGQVIPHYHVHVIPLNDGDEAKYQEKWVTQKLSKEEMSEIQRKLRNI